MAIEAIDTVPKLEEFKPLSEHEEQTPAVFFGGPAVLYCHVEDATVLVSRAQLDETPVLRRLVPEQSQVQSGESEHNDAEQDIKIAGVQVWISSRNVVISGAESSITISYPSIALHAMGTHESLHLPNGAASVVFLQINVHDAETTNSDDDVQTLDLTIHATEIAKGPLASSSDRTEAANAAGDQPQLTAVQALFEALSACADLHPDPNEDDADEDCGIENAEPGAGGWITADNMHEFIDEDGNFLPQSTPLGPGAGTVRARNDDDDVDEEEAEAHDEAHQNGINGTGHEETKWQRTS